MTIKAMEDLLRGMTFDFFGSGNHKIELETLFTTKNAIFLDVRSRTEYESIQLKLEHHVKSLWIPIEELPDRYNEIPIDSVIGAFCTSGTRAAAAYLYLQTLGYKNARIIPGGYELITSQLLPGKLYKFIKSQPEKMK